MNNWDFGNWHLRCHLSIGRTPTEEQVILLKKLAIEIAWFKPFVIETLATKIVQEFDLNPENIIWIQACPANYQESNSTEFSQVTFRWQNGRATDARWLAIAPDLIQELVNQDSEQKTQSSEQNLVNKNFWASAPMAANLY